MTMKGWVVALFAILFLTSTYALMEDTGAIQVVSEGNQTLFTVQTDTGSINAQLLMYPSQERTLTLILQSYVATQQNLVVTCTGAFCSNVDIGSKTVSLAGMDQMLVPVKISVPEGSQNGQKFDFSVQVADAQARAGTVAVHVQVSQVSKWYGKFAVDVKKGDAGYWFSLGSANLPKIILYLLVVAFAELVVYLSLSNKKGEGWAFLIYILVGVVAFVLASAIY